MTDLTPEERAANALESIAESLKTIATLLEEASSTNDDGSSRINVGVDGVVLVERNQ